MKQRWILLIEIILFSFLLCTIVSGQEVMFHYNAEHTGDFSPVAGTIGNTVSLNWKFETGDGIEFSSPIVSDGIMYVGSRDGNVYALNASFGKQLWNFTTNNPIFSTPAVGNGIVYIANGDVYALNSTTGRQIWNFTGDFPVGSNLAISKGIIYFEGGKMYAVNATDGSIIWSFSPYDFGRQSSYSPAVANGVVYAGFIDGNIYALNSTTGSQIWNFTPNTCGCSFTFSTPAIVNDIVYFVYSDMSANTRLYALNATTGLKIWDFYPGGYSVSSPAVSDGIVYVGSDDYNLYAVNATKGQLLWNFTAGEIISSPAVANGAVFFGSMDDSKIYSVNAKTGQQIWNYSTGSGITSSPAIADGALFIGSFDKNVYALNISGGEPLIPKTNPSSKQPSPSSKPTKSGALLLTIVCAMIVVSFFVKKKDF